MSDADFIRRLFPNANPDLLARNSGEATKLEPDLGDAPLGPKKVQRPTGQRFLVRVVSYRKILLDEDNLCPKYAIDLCRYAGALPSDQAGTTKIQTTQIKTVKGEAERTLIEIYELPPQAQET